MSTATTLTQDQFRSHLETYVQAHPTPGLVIHKRDLSHRHLTKLAGERRWAVEVRFNVQNKRIEADLTLRGRNAKSTYDLLHKTFSAGGDAKMGCKVCWEREKKPRPRYPRPRHPESSVSVKWEDTEPENDKQWDDYCAWLVARAATLRCWRLSV